MTHIKFPHRLLLPYCCGTSLLFQKHKKPYLSGFYVGGIQCFWNGFHPWQKAKNKRLSDNIVLGSPHTCAMRPIWKQTCMPNRMARASGKYISCSMHSSCLWFLSLSISVQLLVLSLIVRARTVHTQTIPLLGRIDLMTTSSGRNQWGRGKVTLWGKQDRLWRITEPFISL